MLNRDWNRDERAKEVRGKEMMLLQAGPKKLQLQLRQHMARKPMACQLNFQANVANPLPHPCHGKIIKHV